MKAQAQSYPNADVLYIPNGSTFDPYFRCFYTKVILAKSAESPMYVRSREHLISQSTKLFNQISDETKNNNMVYASAWINSFVGNIPLAAKVRIRDLIQYVPEMQVDEELLKKTFFKAWNVVEKEFELVRYRGYVTDAEKEQLAIWDRVVVEMKLRHYNIRFKDE